MSDADSKVYLFGSVHVLPPGIEWQTPLLTQTIAGAAKVYLEADIGMFAQAWMAYAMISTGLNFERVHWSDKLDDDQYLALEDALAPLGLTVEAAEAYKPWLVALMLQGDPGRIGDAAVQSGVEVTILRGLPADRIGYLETATQQLRVFSAVPEEDQLSLLIASATQPDETAGSFEEIVAAWAAGDLDALLEGFNADLPEEAAMFLDRLIYQRNRNWVGTIETMLADNEQDLIVVGAAHLIGAQGVVSLLSDAGYTVKRVQ